MDTYKYIATVRRDCNNERFISDTYYIRYEDGHESIGSTFVDNTVEDYWTECDGCESENPNCEECLQFKNIQLKLNEVING